MESPCEQLHRLGEVVDYILRGSHMLIVPQGVRGDHHLDAALRMSQSRAPVFGDAKETRVLYVPGCISHKIGGKKLKAPYVVHKLIWNQGKDRERCRSRRVIYPDMRNEYFRLDDFDDVVAAAKAVEGALNSLESSLPVDLWFEPPPEDDEVKNDQATTYKIAKQPIYHRWIDLQTWPASTELHFSTSQMKRKYSKTGAEFNSAWERLWDALGAVFVETNRLRRVTIRSFDPPVRYARALASIHEDA